MFRWRSRKTADSLAAVESAPESKPVPSWRLGPWRLHEPATTITDVLLAAWAFYLGSVTLFWGWDYLQAARRGAGTFGYTVVLRLPESIPYFTRLFLLALCLLAVGMAAAAGAWVHGRGPQLAEEHRRRLWRLISLAMTLAATALYGIAAQLSNALPDLVLGRVGAIAFLTAAALAWPALWLSWRNDLSFGWSQLALGVGALSVAVAAQLSAVLTVQPSSAEFARAWWIGCAVYVLATVLQRIRLGLNRHFDHNAVYHVLQILALWFLGAVAIQTQLSVVLPFYID